MALAHRLLPILEIGAAVQAGVIVHELHVTGAEFHGHADRGVVGQRIHHVDRRHLRRRKPPRAGMIVLAGPQILAGIDAGELTLIPVEDRDLEPGMHPRRHLSAAIRGHRLEQQPRQIRPARQQRIIDGGRGTDATGAARLRRLQAEQTDDIATISVVIELAVGLVVANLRIVDVEAEILHMAQQMALGVLAAETAQMRADAKIADRRFLDAPPSDIEAAQQDEAAPVLQVAQHAGQARGQQRQREMLRRDLPHLPAAGLVPGDGGIEFSQFRRREGDAPIAVPGHVPAIPGSRAAKRAGRHRQGRSVRRHWHRL